MFRSNLRTLAVAFLLASAAGASSAAVNPAVLPDAPMDSLIVVVPERGAQAVQDEAAVAESLAKHAAEHLSAAQGFLDQARARIDIVKKDIEAIDARIKLVKDQKDDPRRTELERDRKGLELRLKSLDARKSMREAEVRFADASRKEAQKTKECLEAERDLASKHGLLAEIRRSATSDAKNAERTANLFKQIREAELRVLQAMRESADRSKDAHAAAADLADARKKLYEAQQEMVQGPK
jgi:chromosome segregation ATPase